MRYHIATALAHLWGHPRKGPCQGHFCCILVELRGAKVTDLRRVVGVDYHYRVEGSNY